MTPAQWLAFLEKKLEVQQRAIAVYEDYYDGRHKLAFATAKFRQSFGPLFNALADNWCEIVVDAPVERLAIEGFRFGEDASDKAWEIWQANRLDAESTMAHTEAVKDGCAYLLVAPALPGEDFPRITVEHPSQVVVATAAGDRRRRVGALKKWIGDDGYAYATLYLPDQVHKYVSQQKTNGRGGKISWGPREGGGANPFASGGVPVIPLENNPTMLKGGRSDLMPAIPLQDAINKEIADMLVASEFVAFPQRVITGLEVPTDEKGTPTSAAELKAAVSRFWAFEDKDVKVTQLASGDLNNYVGPIAMLLQHLAAQTRTPPHYLIGQIVNASGDALKAAETGLVAKVKRKQIDFADSWEEAMRLALEAAGDTGGARQTAAETIWRDPEYRSEGERVDAALKARSLGVPLEACWERIGATPEQIKDWATKIDLPERVATIVPTGSSAGPVTPELAPPATSVTED